MTDKVNRQEQLEGMLHGFHLMSFKKHYLSYARKSELEKIDHVATCMSLADRKTKIVTTDEHKDF